MSTYITSNSEIMNGVPVVRATRVPVSRIVFLLSEGHTVDSIHELYPHITQNILQGVIEELIRDIDARRYEKAPTV